MTTDTLTRAGWIRAGRAAVVLVALTMAAISYAHIRDLALAYGGDSLTAPLLPLGIDGAVAAMTVFMHQAPGLALHLARCVLMAAVGMTVACNTAYGAAFGVTGALLWSSPAVLFVGCVEVSVLMVRKTRPAKSEAERSGTELPALASGPGIQPGDLSASQDQSSSSLSPGLRDRMHPVPARSAQRSTGSLTVARRPATMTVREQAAAAGVSERTMYRRLAPASGNGKAH